MTHEVVVVGAGTAGAAAARALALAGRRVALVDARPLDRAGARWVNGVPPWMFDAAGVPRPAPPERRADAGAFALHGLSGRRYLSVDPAPVWGVDMRALVARLQADAVAAGAEVFAEARVEHLRLEGERPVALTLRQGDHPLELSAPLFVDASGMKGVLRRRVPALHRDCPPVPRAHTCSAAQGVHAIADRAGAEQFLARHDARPGDVVCRVGISGGYSIDNLRVEPDFSEVEILTGAIAQPEYLSGPDILRNVRSREPWIGAHHFGGAGAVPLRRPYDRLGASGLALIGDAACQVFPAHGSGIGIGLIAARVLADAVAGAADPGAAEAIAAYRTTFQRQWGALLAAYDLFRRLSQSLDGPTAEALLAAGLVTHANYRAGMDQRLPAPTPGELLTTLRAAARAPRLAARLAPVLARMPAVVALYRRHPAGDDRVALRRWSRAAATLFGETPDLA